MTEVNFIDGQALTPSSFGETSTTTGSWIPKKYTGSYGTNGFKLNFSDTSAATAAAIGKDSSGNGNNWTPSGISVTAGTTYTITVGAGGSAQAGSGGRASPRQPPRAQRHQVSRASSVQRPGRQHSRASCRPPQEGSRRSALESV